METIRILLVDPDKAVRDVIVQRLHATALAKLIVDCADPKEVEEGRTDAGAQFDVIIFGQSLSAASVAKLARMFRGRDVTVPILLLTRESEARVPSKLQQAGVDDMLNFAEVNTPVFWWTFMSIIKQAEVRKKAEEFDTIRDRLQSINESLACITHEINNPLSVIRLAVYNLKKPGIAGEKKELFLNLLVDNIARVDDQMKKLYEVRSQLGEDATILSKIVAARAAEESIAV